MRRTLPSNRRHYTIVVVTPIGPDCNIEYVLDNIRSIECYIRSSWKMVVVVEPRSEKGHEIQKHYPDVDVVEAPNSYPKNGGLYLKVSYAYRYVVENFRFDALLRMDADALLIGPEPEKDVLHMFKANPKIAIAGQYPNQYNGKPWVNKWGRDEIIKAITWQLIRRPRGNSAILYLYLRAIRYGYKAGDFVFGGVCFLSEPFLMDLYQRNMLPFNNLGRCWLEEDHQYGLVARAYGYEFGDLQSGKLPFACDWRYLPALPSELLEAGKKIIHSTRGWKAMNEDDVRAFFRIQRQKHLSLNKKTNWNLESMPEIMANTIEGKGQLKDI